LETVVTLNHDQLPSCFRRKEASKRRARAKFASGTDWGTRSPRGKFENSRAKRGTKGRDGYEEFRGSLEPKEKRKKRQAPEGMIGSDIKCLVRQVSELVKGQ